MADVVTFNNKWFNDLSRSPGVAALVDEAVDRVAKTARETAPGWDAAEGYADGIVTASKLQERYVGLVIATHPLSMVVEAKRGTLARALRANTKGRRRA